MSTKACCAIFLGIALALPLPVQAGAYDEIIIAARENRSEVVMDYVRRGMDPNTADATGTTLLMYAARNGNAELLEFLLKSRANILKANKFGDTPLAVAALAGNLPIVRQLLAAGAKASGPGWNALHYAAYAGHLAVAEFLVKSGGAVLDQPAPNRQTALMLAARNGHLPIVRLLVDADADMDLDDAEGNSALAIAIKAGHGEIADYLRREGAVAPSGVPAGGRDTGQAN
jgi:hypothetical protein